MAYEPNEQQVMAIEEFDADLLVAAGAGTGKTTVLTKKYLTLLEQRRAEVNEIVAITFTKKAAAEMNARIQKAIREKSEQAVGPEEVLFWRNQSAKIENARITTFHSLCLGLIREHPVEAGIPPATGVLDEGEETLLLEQTIDAVLTKAIQDDGLDRKLLNRLLFETDWQAFAGSLAALYRKIRESGLEFQEAARLSIVNLQTGLAVNPVTVSNLNSEIEELLLFAPNQKLTDRAQELIGTFSREWPRYRQTMLQTEELDRVLPVLAEIKKALPKNLPNCLKERVTEVHRLTESLAAKLLDREALPRLALLQELLERIDCDFKDVKIAAGALDFTDQQLLARQLLRDNPQLTEEIRQGIRYIMVDEFQDTNSLQLELIRLLTGDGYSGGRLMAVGDIKQSIYHFRGAEAGVILGLDAQMRAGRGRVVPLTRNYRSSRLIISFINQISQKLFAREGFIYEPLESSQPDSGAQLELVCCGTADLQTQARLVARRIAGLVRESQATECPVNYQDIVLLFRAGKAMPNFQQAMQELGIPCYMAGGGSFYQQPEIVDQLNLLRLVQQRYDAVALCGLLISPYVGLTEEQLLLIGRGQPLLDQFYALEMFPGELEPAVQERLLRFREVITFLQENRELSDIPGIIRYALERLDYRELLWTLPQAGQRLANLEKLLLKADQFAAKGYYQLADFLAYIQDLETIAVKESEAQTQTESGNVVRLMTIHRSKGLEFPVVILPDLDHRFAVNSRERFCFHKEVGIGFKIPVENADAGETSLWRRIKELDRWEETAELKRVLYVALTRAKQRLIFVGSGLEKAPDKTLATAANWMQWLGLLLPPVDNETTQLDYDGIPIRIIRDLPEETSPSREQTLLNVYAAQLDTPLPETSAEVAAVASPVCGMLKLKVTGILTYKECPRQFYLQYCLNLPEQAGPERRVDNDHDRPGGDFGAKIGAFLHQAVRLKPLDVWPEQLWRQTFGDLTGETAAQLRQDVKLMWRNFRRSEFGRESSQIWDEVPFQVKLDQNLRVEGRFDRLLQHEQGELVLVDYKTHRVGRSKVTAIAPQYFWQLQLYTLAIKAIWGRKPDRAMLYFLYPDMTVSVPIADPVLDATVKEVQTLGRLLSKQRPLTDFPKRAACGHCAYEWFCQRTPG
jgi:ATP-dependent helicase/nuclease subunit A